VASEFQVDAGGQAQRRRDRVQRASPIGNRSPYGLLRNDSESNTDSHVKVPR
jgi:hypothetical protein